MTETVSRLHQAAMERVSDDSGQRLAMAEAAMGEALQLCLSGATGKGLARYENGVPGDLIHLLPVGLHLHLLEQADSAAADGFRAFALRKGGDLSWRASVGKGGLAEQIAEYEALFARGLATPVMIDRYAQLLARAGQAERAARFYDVERLLWRTRIDDGTAAAQALLALEAEMPLTTDLSVRETRKLPKLDRMGHAVFDPLLARFRTEAEAYCALWRASDHPLAHVVPAEFGMISWGLISRGAGHNSRHVHSHGWLTGVYYPVGVAPEIAGGALRVGNWDDAVHPGWPDATIRPEPGLLVLMPSYYVHWTEPLGVPGLRMSIVFDAIPREEAR